MYKIDFFNLGKFNIVASLSGITATEDGHDFTVDSLQCYYDGDAVGVIREGFQAFIDWLGLRGLEFFPAIQDELNHQEHAIMAFNSLYDEGVAL